jgi:hypothetical protein
LSGLIVVLYTTAGGIVGAGVTQYVTHIRDRRSARALVIERLSEVEETYVSLRWPMTNDTPYIASRIARQLGSLKAAALVAGVPRAVITCYVTGCQYYEDARRMSRSANLLAQQLTVSITENTQAISALPNVAEIKQRLATITESIESILSQLKEGDKRAFGLHDNSLSLLGKTLWHPIIFQLNRRRLRSLQKSANSLERNGQRLSGLLRQLESFYDQTSPEAFLLVVRNMGQSTASIAGNDGKG